MNRLDPSPLRRSLSALLAFLVGFGPITPLAFAAPTPLADGPINVNIKAKPNIVFSLDDSTSMQLDFLPDYVVVNSLTNAATNYCRSNTGLTNCGSVGSATVPQYTYANWGIPTGAGNPFPAGYGNSTYGPPAVMASAFNAMFYNPNVTYAAPLKHDGTTYPDMNSANTTGFTKVPADPYLYPTKYVNLVSKVSVGVWCNTSYAGNFTFPNGVSADRNGIAIGGDHCRINGYPYTTGSNGAPETKGDYSYPFARNAAGPANANFYSITTRSIFCDPDRMNGSLGTGTETAPTAPTCEACTASCPVAQVEDPTSPPGCDLGCTNPAECTKCNLKCPVDLTYSCGRTCTTAGLNCSASGGSIYPAIGPTTCDAGPNQRCVTHPGACATTSTWNLGPRICTTVITGVSRTAATDPVPAAAIGKTYEQDANGAGEVCRRNNFVYADGAADGWKYPETAGVRKYSQALTSSCGSISASINRHYYKAAVQWCDAQLATGGSNDKWRGYGKGNCQEEKTATYKYPKFVKYGSDLATVVDNYAYDAAAFELVELDYANAKIIVRNGTPATSITHDLPDGESITRDSTSSTPETSELVNYANWFAYYRTRILASKTVTSLAFSELTDKFRVGFQSLSAGVTSSQFLNVADFKSGSGDQRDLWFGKLFSQSIPMGNDTPLLDGVVRIGEWFKAVGGTHPDLPGSSNPINLSCQKNYHIMFTDGYTNQAAKPSTLVGNVDGANIPPKSDDTMPEDILDLVPGTQWPLKFREGATGIDDSLADYALHYWLKDLRPPTFAEAVAENNVPTSEKDPAKWQHLNFAALSLGTEGVLSSKNVTATETKIAAGTLQWTTPSPNVYRPGVTGVDDLWHAAINGRSLFVNARDPAELQTGMALILSEIKNLQASRAGVAFSNVNFSADNNFIYRVTIEPGFGGTLTKVKVDPGEGNETAIITKYHEKLTAQVTPATVGDEPWYDDRRVVTWIPSQAKADAFVYAKLDSAQLSTLGLNADVQKKVIAYLRGDKSNEGTAAKNFRIRSQVLGDIVTSSPVVVGSPNAPYSDANDPGYESYKGTSRKRMLYVGSNDGMLHAFDEDAGSEVFAYIPSFAYSSDADKGLKILAKKDPFFKHQMFVDATPVAADVDIGGTWKTMLVGGLGKGGKGYYGIDVTDPDGVTSEAEAAGRVKWEFTDSDLGYSYGKPLIAKTRAHGWVAVVSSGHNNASGKGKLFFIGLADGTLLKTLETTAGSSTTPSGLGQIAGFVIDYHNQVLEQIYGGDLLGNVWRFDVSNADASTWTVEKFAELTSTDGTAQSITVAPQIEVDFTNGIDRWVIIGTGRMLDESDLLSYGEQVQTMYALRDGTVLTKGGGLPHKPRTASGFEKITDGIAGLSALPEKGWLHDLPKGERIIAPIQAEVNLVVYAGALPPENECLTGLAANLYGREFTKGASQLRETDGGAFVDHIYSAEGAVGVELIKLYKGEGAAQPTVRVAITLGSDGKMISFPVNLPGVSAQHRMSWRLLGQ